MNYLSRAEFWGDARAQTGADGVRVVALFPSQVFGVAGHVAAEALVSEEYRVIPTHAEVGSAGRALAAAAAALIASEEDARGFAAQCLAGIATRVHGFDL